jgi:hypothetical protein
LAGASRSTACYWRMCLIVLFLPAVLIVGYSLGPGHGLLVTGLSLVLGDLISRRPGECRPSTTTQSPQTAEADEVLVSGMVHKLSEEHAAHCVALSEFQLKGFAATVPVFRFDWHNVMT